MAIVHDYLTQKGGAERVVLSMLKAWPGAPVYTSLYDPARTFPAFRSADVKVLPLNNIEPLRQRHRAALPLLAASFSRLRISADVVVCSSSGWAHGARTDGKKVVYCHTPARWLYQADRYLGTGKPVAAAGLKLVSPYLRRWDRTAASSADVYLANSTAVRDRIQELYGINAEVVPPPHSIDPGGPQEQPAVVSVPFFLSVTRLLPYKNVDKVIEAFRTLDSLGLIVVGSGPERKRLEEAAPANVHFFGTVSDSQLRWLYANCQGVVSAAYEDLGLVPIEAAAFGKPAAVLRWGGFLDTVLEGTTGILFQTPEPPDIAGAVTKVCSSPFDSAAIQAHAASFSEPNFIKKLRDVVDRL